jgi:predicted DCC family thiol-disulfide oxidoreductase YuxK
MHALKARDRDGRLLLVDCSAPGFDDRGFAAEGITQAAMLARIHARDARGRWLQGVDVFVEAYRAAGLERVAVALENPRVRPWFGRIYPWIARNRYVLSRLGLFRVYDRIAARARRSDVAVDCGGNCDRPGRASG